jgi:hypothetical protein
MTEGINKVTLKGRILNIYNSNGGIAIAKIDVGNSHPDVVFTKEFADHFLGEYKCGDWIMLEGNIQSSYSSERGIRISIIVDRILPLSYSRAKYVNHLEIYGTVKNVIQFGEMHKVNVNVVSNGYASVVPLTFFDPLDHRLNAETGEPLRCLGIVHTSQKQYGDKVKYFQNYVADGVF